MEVFDHTRITGQHPPWYNIGVGIIHLVLLVVLNLLFILVVVKVAWVLGLPNFPPRNFIFGFMVVFFCHIRVVIIHP